MSIRAAILRLLDAPNCGEIQARLSVSQEKRQRYYREMQAYRYAIGKASNELARNLSGQATQTLQAALKDIPNEPR